MCVCVCVSMFMHMQGYADAQIIYLLWTQHTVLLQSAYKLLTIHSFM